MKSPESWDWETGRKEVPFSSWQDRYEWVEEPQSSPDGESVAAIVKTGESEFNVCVNGDTWDSPFEKIWHLRYSPNGRTDGDRLRKRRVDPGRRRRRLGEPVRISSGNPVSAPTGPPSPSSSSRTWPTAWC